MGQNLRYTFGSMGSHDSRARASPPAAAAPLVDVAAVVAGEDRAPAASAPPASAVFQQADSARVEDFYEYKFPFPVRIASRQSALLPFLQKTMNVERLSIFNARTDRGNPRLGARLENNTDIPFEAGPVTFFQDTRYAGEAVLDYLPRGEKSLVSYGIDNDIQISQQDPVSAGDHSSAHGQQGCGGAVHGVGSDNHV